MAFWDKWSDKKELPSPEPYGYLTSGQGEEGEEVEEPIEGEWRELGGEVGPWKPMVEKEEREGGEAEEEEEEGTSTTRRRRGPTSEEVRAAEAKAAWEKRKLELEQASMERVKRKGDLGEVHDAEKWKWEKREVGARRRGRVVKEVAGYAKGTQKALTLGGMPAMSRKGTQQFYMGKPEKSLYEPTAPSTGGLRGSPAGKALAPDLGTLRSETLVRAPVKRDVGVSQARELVTPPSHLRIGPSTELQEVGMPRGLSRLEQAAFAEIHANGDRDTLAHVQDELRKLSIPRSEALRAVKSLEQKGVVEKTVDKKGKSPVYEVVRA